MPYVRTLIADLVEFSTSEGSSCPPADPQLGQLRRDATLAPPALHVGYLDALGWRDPDGEAGS